MGDGVGLRVAAGGHVKAPRLDAALPVGPREGHVWRAVSVRRAGADKVAFGAAVVARVIAIRGFGGEAVKPRAALGVGGGAGQWLASAVGHRHLRASDGLAFVQRGHPRQRIFAPQLEVDGQIGHQRRGAHIHGATGAVFRVQQRRPQQRRSNFDHVKTGFQRNADHLKRAWVSAGGARHFQRLRCAVAAQQRDHARLHIVFGVVVVALAARDDFGQRTFHIALRLLAVDQKVVVGLDFSIPSDDLRVALRLQRAHFGGDGGGFGGRLGCSAITDGQTLHRQRGLDFAQRHRQQRRAVGTFGKALNDAKRRSGKLGQRRHTTRGDSQRKAVGIAQRAPASVVKILWQLQLEGHVLGKRGGKLHLIDQPIRAVVARRRSLRGNAFLAGLEANRRRQLARHRRVKRQAQRANRQASGLGVFALAAQIGAERRAHFVGKALFHPVGNAAGRDYAFAPDQLHLGRWRQTPVASQRLPRQRLLGGAFVKILAFEQFGALRAFNQAHGNALADAFGLAPDVLLHAGQRRCAIQLQDEKLLFVNLAPRAGVRLLHKRTAAIEGVAASARQCCARGRFEAWFQLRRAAHAGRQVVGEIKHPFALTRPAATALAGLRVAAQQRQRRGRLRVAKTHRCGVELHHHLARAGDFALRRETGDLQRLRAPRGDAQGHAD